MIIEYIAVLDEPARPRPDHVHVLRLIAVEAVMRHIHEFERDHEREKTRGCHKLGRAGHPKVIGASLRDRAAARGRRPT